jgi:hypothetical protein
MKTRRVEIRLRAAGQRKVVFDLNDRRTVVLPKFGTRGQIEGMDLNYMPSGKGMGTAFNAWTPVGLGRIRSVRFLPEGPTLSGHVFGDLVRGEGRTERRGRCTN